MTSGFLPGEEQDKLKPWMSALYDAVDNLFDNKQKYKEVKPEDYYRKDKMSDFSVEHFIDTYRDAGLLEMKTFNYMRGRTLSNALVIADEAQETTPHLAKLMLTRAGDGAKFIFIGDPSDNQIDNVLVDSKSNGLVYTVEKIKTLILQLILHCSKLKEVLSLNWQKSTCKFLHNTLDRLFY